MIVLREMHEMALIHRNVTPESLLFASNGSVRLGGFDHVHNATDEEPSSMVGSLYYAAPDILLCESYNIGAPSTEDLPIPVQTMLTYGESVRNALLHSAPCAWVVVALLKRREIS